MRRLIALGAVRSAGYEDENQRALSAVPAP